MSPPKKKQQQDDEPATQIEETGYVALARRFRPLVLDDVIGEDHVTRTLKNALAAGRVHHAYLFTGSRGVGKTTVARIMARLLNKAIASTATAEDALAAETETDFDLIEIDGASHTGVDDVRQLRENARYLPSRGDRKVYIIDEVHMLSTSAFNALLKTLEEPPAHVTFIFATTEPHKIPATVLSRCQRFDFKRVPTNVIRDHLKHLAEVEKISVTDEGLALVARAAEGSVRDGLTLLDQVIVFAQADQQIDAKQIADALGIADRRVLFDLSRAVLNRDPGKAIAVVSSVFNAGADLAHFGNDFLGHLRDLVVVATCGKNVADLVEASAAELSELASLVSNTDASLLEQHFDHFARAVEQLGRSSFPKLLLEMTLIEMIHSEPLVPLAELIERLESLEGRLSQSGKAGRGVRSPSSGQMSSGGTRAGGPSGRASQSQQRGSGPNKTTEGAQELAEAEAGATPPPAASGVGSGTPPPAASGAEATLRQWRTLLERIDPLTASPYVAGQLLKWSDDAIELGYAVKSFELERARSRDKLTAFEKACGKALKRTVRLIVRDIDPNGASSEEAAKLSALQARDRERQQKRSRLRDEARAHPVTQELVDKFGAEIDQIVTPAEES